MKIFILYKKQFGVWGYVFQHKDSNVVMMHQATLRDAGHTTWIDVITDEELLGSGATIKNNFNVEPHSCIREL